MISVLLIALVVAFLVMAFIALLVFFRAAFWGERDMADEGKKAAAWRPPFLQGDALRTWAASTAGQLVQARLSGRRTGAKAVHVAGELEEASLRAMLPLARPAELERVVACPETGQGRVGVTVPEALALVAELRKSCSRADQARIQRLALENSREIQARSSDAKQQAPLPCPLQGIDRVCCAYGTRPLQCRPFHAQSVAISMGSRSPECDRSTAETTEIAHAKMVAQGVEIGLTRALAEEGLDANVYELNSILAKLMETPDAADRWMNGENVFGTCGRLTS